MAGKLSLKKKKKKKCNIAPEWEEHFLSHRIKKGKEKRKKVYYQSTQQIKSSFSLFSFFSFFFFFIFFIFSFSEILCYFPFNFLSHT